MIRAALIQLRSGTDMARNLAEASALIREAVGQGATFVSTPEMTNILEPDRPRLRALALLGTQRYAGMPEVPTAAEQGYAGLESYVWFGLFAPARTPPALIGRLNKAIVSYLKRPDVTEAFLKAGAQVVASSPAELAAAMKADMAKWGKVIKDAGIRVE